VTESDFRVQRERVRAVKAKLAGSTDPDAANLLALADFLMRRSVWIVGGDGWAYDIDSGGLDHVLATGKNVNILVLDTEVYSNTGRPGVKGHATRRDGKFARRARRSRARTWH
jgi:pyruvate-ferredoxin/flavodoxin oxidoreductase